MADWKADDIIQRIHDARGNLAAVARSLGVSRTTVYRYMESRPTVKTATEEARETMLDNAESVLYKKVLDGDTTSLIFFLKTQGKTRGYVERGEVTGKDGNELVLRVVYGDADDPAT